jgi:hypothetical protein
VVEEELQDLTPLGVGGDSATEIVTESRLLGGRQRPNKETPQPRDPTASPHHSCRTRIRRCLDAGK